MNGTASGAISWNERANQKRIIAGNAFLLLKPVLVLDSVQTGPFFRKEGAGRDKLNGGNYSL